MINLDYNDLHIEDIEKIVAKLQYLLENLKKIYYRKQRGKGINFIYKFKEILEEINKKLINFESCSQEILNIP